MNYKQKLGYIVLGAAMTLVGVAVSALSPSLSAQKRGEYIVCTGLTVVDGKGNDTIRLTVGETGIGIIIFDRTGEVAIGLGVNEIRGNEILLSDKAGNTAIGLRADQTTNRIAVYDKTGREGFGTLYADEIGSGLIIYDQPSNVKWKAP